MTDEHEDAGPDSASKRAKISKASLMSQGDDFCPSCNAELASKDATVCLACGYDLKSNTKISTSIGSAEYAPEEAATFCRTSRIPWQAILGAGGVLTIAAFALAWGDAPESKRPFFYALQTLVYIFVHTGLGVVAVITAAMLLKEKVGPIEYGVAWIAVAIGAFFASIQVGQLLGANATAEFIVGASFGCVLFLAALWQGFRTSRDVILMIAGLQFVFWLLLRVYGWVADLAEVVAA